MIRFIPIWTRWLARQPGANILLFLFLALPISGQAKITGTSPNSGSGQSAVPILMPNLEQLEKQLLRRNAAAIPALTAAPTVNVSASVTTNPAEADKGHLAWTLGGVQTSPAWMVDPYRIINGQTNPVAAGWINFSGRIVSGNQDGILLDGTLTTIPKSADNTYVGEFFLENYPYPCAINGTIGSYNQWFYARLAGTYTCTNDAAVVQTLYLLDYGQPWTPPPPTLAQYIAQIKSVNDAKAAAEARQDAILNRVLKDNEESAARGEPYGLMRMGERYRDGKGVERDLTKARDFFQAAADAGSDTAKSELENLNVLYPPQM